MLGEDLSRVAGLSAEKGGRKECEQSQSEPGAHILGGVSLLDKISSAELILLGVGESRRQQPGIWEGKRKARGLGER